MTKRWDLKILDKILMLGTAVAVLLFVLWPFIAVFVEGLRDYGLDEMWEVARKSRFLIRNSLQLAVLVTFLTTFIATCVAIATFYASKKVKNIIQAILLVSLVSPPFVSALSYINLFGRRGIISYRLLGLSTNPYGLYGLVLMQSFSFISLAALMLTAKVRETDQSVVDSALSLGAKTRHVIRDVILPHLRPSISVVLILTFIRSLSDFSTPAIIGGRYNVLASEAYLAFIAQGDLRRATVLNVLLFIPAFVAFVIYMRSYRAHSSTSHGLSSEARLNEGRGILLWFTRTISLAFVVWLALQYGSIFLQAFGRYRKGEFYFTVQNWVEAIPYVRGAFVRSIVYSLISSAGCVLLGYLIAYYQFIRKKHWMKAVDWIATMPYIVPGTFFGIGYILAFRSEPLALTGTVAIVILNMLFKQLPFASKIASSAVAGIDEKLPDVVRDLGGHPLYSFKDVLLGQSYRDALIGFLNSFASGMTTIGSIIFLVYPGRKLATLVLFDVIQSSNYHVASVISAVIMLICVAVNFLSFIVSGGSRVSRAR